MKGNSDQVYNTASSCPGNSINLLTDIKYFFTRKPAIGTYVKIHSEEEKKEISQRIFQRTGVIVDNYNVLNLHKIAVDTPAQYLFEEVMKWDGNSCWWPNHIAHVSYLDNDKKNIKINLFKPVKIFNKEVGKHLAGLLPVE